MTDTPWPLDGRLDHPTRHPRQAPGYETVLLGDDVDVDACDGYTVLVVDQQLGEVDSYGPYHHAEAEAERLRRRRAVEADALDDVHVQLARFHWPAAHGAVHSPFGHDCGGSTDPSGFLDCR